MGESALLGIPFKKKSPSIQLLPVAPWLITNTDTINKNYTKKVNTCSAVYNTWVKKKLLHNGLEIAKIVQ